MTLRQIIAALLIAIFFAAIAGAGSWPTPTPYRPPPTPYRPPPTPYRPPPTPYRPPATPRLTPRPSTSPRFSPTPRFSVTPRPTISPRKSPSPFATPYKLRPLVKLPPSTKLVVKPKLNTIQQNRLRLRLSATFNKQASKTGKQQAVSSALQKSLAQRLKQSASAIPASRLSSVKLVPKIQVNAAAAQKLRLRVSALRQRLAQVKRVNNSQGADKEKATAEGTPQLLRAGPFFDSKIESQLAKRGWTKDLVQSTIDAPTRTVVTRDTRWTESGSRRDDPATAYYSTRGGYVVRNDRTGEVVQVSDRTDPGWTAPWDKQENEHN